MFKNCWTGRALVLKEWVEELLVDDSEKYIFYEMIYQFFLSVKEIVGIHFVNVDIELVVHF